MSNIIKAEFTHIYQTNVWANNESRSGSGSTVAWCRNIMEELPQLLKELGATTMLDCACGDLNWMKHVGLPVSKYIGVDVVEELIEALKKDYANDFREFHVMDITVDKLPKVDLIICKDCLVHLPLLEGRTAIQSMIDSGSRYMLLTDYPAIIENNDIRVGEWRRINLTLSPYDLPQPIKRIPTLIDHTYLSLWEINPPR